MSKHPFLDGVIVPAYTAAGPDGSLDAEGMTEYVRWLNTRRGVGCVFVRCGVGRMYTFCCDEVKAVTDAALRAGGVPVIAGVGGIWNRDYSRRADPETYLRESVELGRYALERGCAGVVAVIPDGLDLPEGEDPMSAVIEYYETLDRELEGPVILYHTPGLEERFALTPEALARIARLPGIAGMKYSVGELDKFAAMARTALEAAPGDFVPVCGNEYIYHPALEFGAGGVIGGGCNKWPELLHVIGEAHRKGDPARSKAAADALMELAAFQKTLSIDEDALFCSAWAAADGFRVRPHVRKGRDIYAEGGPSAPERPAPRPVSPQDFRALRDRIVEAAARFA